MLHCQDVLLIWIAHFKSTFVLTYKNANMRKFWMLFKLEKIAWRNLILHYNFRIFFSCLILARRVEQVLIGETLNYILSGLYGISPISQKYPIYSSPFSLYDFCVFVGFVTFYFLVFFYIWIYYFVFFCCTKSLKI